MLDVTLYHLDFSPIPPRSCHSFQLSSLWKDVNGIPVSALPVPPLSFLSLAPLSEFGSISCSKFGLVSRSKSVGLVPSPTDSHQKLWASSTKHLYIEL